ncbi:MAG: pyridoxine 5'-phosphate synthase [Sphingobacteriales bacterium]|nr:MAG: pyridoxine 5'-phosphate synthase [Sphingobacteriales bacterium]
MVNLSVNINKIALIRNSRGSNYPNLIEVAKDCERFGANGITVHPRPDERHVKFDDLLPLKNIVTTELNVEGYPSQYFIDKILAIKPHQCTLVPDADNQLTSDHGWDTIKNFDFLKDIVQTLQSKNIRTSLFIDADVNMIEHAAKLGVDRIEYYTGPFAKEYYINKENAISSIKETVEIAHQLGLGINAGHDLNLDNLKFFKNNVPYLEEVSIGHAIVCDALYFGLENTIKMYLHQINA